MPTCDHLQPFQDKTYEEEGSRGGGEEGEGRGERVRGPGDPKLGGAVNFYCNSLFPFVSFVFDDFILGTRGCI